MNEGADANTANLMGMARTAALAGNSTEAMGYFNRVLEIDPGVSEAWIGKGKAAGWQSTLAHIRLNEMLVAFNHAIATAPTDQKEEVTTELVLEVNRLATTLYDIARRHLLDYVSLNNSWPDYLNQVAQMLDALEEVRNWRPSDRTTLENIVYLCKDNIEGVAYRDEFNNNAPGVLHISPSYEEFLAKRMASATGQIQASDPSYSPPVVEKKTAEACFVVTATMGDYDHPTVRLLRRFRDEWLQAKPLGSELIASYYRVGPTAAWVIKRSPLLRRLSYRMIVRPVARFAAWVLKGAQQSGLG